MTPDQHLSLGTGGEFDRIRRIWHRLGDRAAPSGDDCAFVDLDGVQLAVSNDLTLQGTHFLPGWLSLPELGWRAGMAALSDLAAVAATPSGVQVALGISDEEPEDAAADVRMPRPLFELSSVSSASLRLRHRGYRRVGSRASKPSDRASAIGAAEDTAARSEQL